MPSSNDIVPAQWKLGKYVDIAALLLCKAKEQHVYP